MYSGMQKYSNEYFMTLKHIVLTASGTIYNDTKERKNTYIVILVIIVAIFLSATILSIRFVQNFRRSQDKSKRVHGIIEKIIRQTREVGILLLSSTKMMQLCKFDVITKKVLSGKPRAKKLKLR